MSKKLSILALLSMAAFGLAVDVPENVRSLYNNIRAKGQCDNKLASGFYAQDRGSNSFSYCGDHLKDFGIVYLQGTGGALADMDVDCDGAQGGPADDGRCVASRDTQSVTTFQSVLTAYRAGIGNLDANVHPYVVFGNEGSRSGWKTFNPRSVGVEPLSIIAVVCGDKLIYGVWGDTNGDDGTKPMVGEAAISLATACYGTGITGGNGHDVNDVLYIAFTGKDAVPGAQGANWTAADYNSFASSIQAQGDTLVQRIGKSAGNARLGMCAWGGECAIVPLIVSAAAAVFLI